MNLSSIVFFVVPTMRISGGNLEAVRLAGELRLRGVDARILSLWKHPNSIQRLDIPSIPDVPVTYISQRTPNKLRAPFDLLFLLFTYWNYLRRIRRQSHGKIPAIVLTHYSTFFFAWFTPAAMRFCFLQDEEWLFVRKGIIRNLLRRFILTCCSHCKVITSNSYISRQICAAGIIPVAEAPVWADQGYLSSSISEDRPIDIVMVLRKGYIKRLDLYEQLVPEIKKLLKNLSCAVITCEDDIVAEATKFADICLLRPSSEEMKNIFGKSKIFILLSEREGFGLPPLEAMGSGCVPICRDSGGVRCYMTGNLQANLVSLDAAPQVILGLLYELLLDKNRLQELSYECRKIFVAGAENAKRERNNALAIISSL